MGRLLDAKEMEDTTGSTWLSSGSGLLNTTLLGASGRGGISPFEGVTSGQIIGREHSPSHHQKIGLKIYPPIRARP